MKLNHLKMLQEINLLVYNGFCSDLNWKVQSNGKPFTQIV